MRKYKLNAGMLLYIGYTDMFRAYHIFRKELGYEAYKAINGRARNSLLALLRENEKACAPFTYQARYWPLRYGYDDTHCVSLNPELNTRSR